ncbi:hypothetical protein [Clostridium ljungdahlii]|uniref:Uncharacterized protein n=1 Tax=Clostridium ljungdahlii TaxID=1538 RepID=A0A168PIR5_9CLOT|nr:hypothetical protein [Clostridium ljungdahlii]OAA87794.1 hypothetical protein WY13_01909 [Clostridium ljungdahlii]
MKVIISNNAKKHMKVHETDFVVNWKELLKKCEIEGKFDSLNKSFEIVKIEFEYNIGYCKCIQTKPEDEIVFAKRTGREIYSRLVKNRRAELVKSIVFILNKNRNNDEEYFLITAFPASQSFKEPEDLNIKSKNELKECLQFWKGHALIYDENIIDIDSIKDYCPYKNLYIAVA